MEIAKALEFLQANHRAVLATRRADGRPQLSPVMAGVDGEGYVVISSRETALKVKNLLRDPQASLCAFTDDFFGGWVQVDGEATIVHLPEAMEQLVSLYTAMEREQRVVIRIAIGSAGPDRAG